MSKIEVTFSNVVKSRTRPEYSLSGDELGDRGRHLEGLVVNGESVELVRVERKRRIMSNYYDFSLTLLMESADDLPEVGAMATAELSVSLDDTAWYCTRDCQVVNKWGITEVQDFIPTRGSQAFLQASI
jgi:hypothetical protein